MIGQQDSPIKKIGCRWYLLVAFLISIGCSSINISSALKGRVVQKETGKAIPGAVVVRVWDKYTNRLFIDSDSRVLKADEVLTDENGAFNFGRKVIFSLSQFPFKWILESHVAAYKPGFRSNRKHRVNWYYNGGGSFVKDIYNSGNLGDIELTKLPDSYYLSERRMGEYQNDWEKGLPLLQAAFEEMENYHAVKYFPGIIYFDDNHNRIRSPKNINVDEKGNVYVLNKRSKARLIFSENGQYLGYTPKRTATDNSYKPSYDFDKTKEILGMDQNSMLIDFIYNRESDEYIILIKKKHSWCPSSVIKHDGDYNVLHKEDFCFKLGRNSFWPVAFANTPDDKIVIATVGSIHIYNNEFELINNISFGREFGRIQIKDIAINPSGDLLYILDLNYNGRILKYNLDKNQWVARTAEKLD